MIIIYSRKSHFSLKCRISRERCCSWTVLHTQCASVLVSWKNAICHSVLCLIAFTFVEIVRYPINTVHWLSHRLDEEQLPSFTQRPTPWQTWLTYSMWITDSRILGSVWCIQSIVLTVKGGSAVTRWCDIFCVVFGKTHAAFMRKNAIFGFLVSPRSTEAQVRWDGQIK